MASLRPTDISIITSVSSVVSHSTHLRYLPFIIYHLLLPSRYTFTLSLYALLFSGRFNRSRAVGDSSLRIFFPAHKRHCFSSPLIPFLFTIIFRSIKITKSLFWHFITIICWGFRSFFHCWSYSSAFIFITLNYYYKCFVIRIDFYNLWWVIFFRKFI